MQTRFRIFSLGVGAAMILSLGLSSIGSFFNAVNAQEADPLVLTAVSSRGSWVQLEPISLRLEVSNTSDRPIAWRGSLGVGRDIRFVTRGAGGEELVWNGGDYIGLVAARARMLEPGERFQQDVLLEGTLLEHLFPQPGQYDLRVEFNYRANLEGNQQVRVSSNPVSLTITEPTGVDRLAYVYIKGPLAAAFSDKRLDSSKIVQSQQEFVDRFGDSVYTKYVVFQLANTYVGLGEHRKAAREICKLVGQNFYYSKAVESKTYELEAKIRPFTFPAGLPEDAPPPERPHPCSRMLN